MLAILPAAASPVDDYSNAVHRALSLVQFAESGDEPSLRQAILIVEQLPGPAQVEILRDLRAQPAKLADASQRLQGLYSAMQQHTDTPNPERAQQQLRDVLSMPRYAGLGTGPSLLERVVTTVLRAVGQFLIWLGLGNLRLNVPVWVWFALTVMLILLIIFWPIRTGISFGGRQARTRVTPAVPSPSADFFAQADRLAAAGDYVGATRALAGGVAVRLSGERVWDQSPYTVRELFSRTEHPEKLRPLLGLFEEASYGNRRPDQASYARAAQAAEPCRKRAA